MSISHQGDISFTVHRDNSVSGNGMVHEEYFHTDTSGGGDTCDSKVDATFSVSGYVSDGRAYLQFSDLSVERHVCEGNYGKPYEATDVFGSYRSLIVLDLMDSAVYYADAPSAILNPGGRVDGQSTLTLDGETPATECPALTITPTMPPASDPRNFADPTDTASYRFEVDWDGTTPVSVYFDAQGGGGSVNLNFAFNPASMQSSPINVIMDVTTDAAELGDYPITVVAWVIDPDTGEECHAIEVAEVVLVVGESRAADLDLIKRFGQVEITQEETEAGSQNVKITTGGDGLATLVVAGIEKTNDAVSATTIDVGSNTAASEYDHADHFAKVLDERAKASETPEWIANYFQKYKQPGVLEKLKELILEVSVSDSAVYSCLFAPIDSNSADLCGEHSIAYVSDGELHIHHQTATGEAADRLMVETEKQVAELAWDKLFRALATPNTLIIPEGTELTVNVEQSSGSSITSVTLLEGSAIVVDLASEEVQLVNTGERYTLETSFAGQSVSSTDKLDSVSKDSVLHWWKVQIGDFYTHKNPYSPSDPNYRTSVFNEDNVAVRIEFINVPAWTSHVIDFKWYGPDGSLLIATVEHPDEYQVRPSERFDYWPSYSVGSAAGGLGMLGQYNVKVYYDGDLVKEIPFTIEKLGTNGGESGTPTNGGGCLIATAAFGSELTPQVQFLRDFRDNHILSTAAGSSFMNVFNSWYYSFSPSVADYEREQPWLQQTVKTAIYPLLGILTVSEKAYASMPGEYGAVTAGIIASSMIGAVYIWPAAFAMQRFNGYGKRMSNNLTIALIGAAVVAAIISLLATNPAALMVTTSFVVLTVVAVSALFSARLIRYVINRIIKR